MNNLQHIIKDDTRAAMHVAVELCERGDFDSVTEAFRWLMREREDDTLGSDEANVDECKRIILEGKKQLTAAEQRIEQLESLVRDLYGQLLNAYDQKEVDEFTERMAALGLMGGVDE